MAVYKVSSKKSLIVPPSGDFFWVGGFLAHEDRIVQLLGRHVPGHAMLGLSQIKDEKCSVMELKHICGEPLLRGIVS